MPTSHHAPRPKFHTLFIDPRHFRGDCRLVRTAIRRGWLDDAPQADRDALVARFEQVTREQDAAGWESAGRQIRAILARVQTVAAMVDSDQREEARALRTLRYSLGWTPTGQTTGRPRERWHVSDYLNRIDANELRRRAKADGTDLRTIHAIDVLPGDKPDNPERRGERVALAVVADARYGWRVWLVCPRCGSRRVHLYPTRAGIRCRKCAGVRYA